MMRSEIFAALKKRGIARVDVTFSGGNDEGGVDAITVFDQLGNEIGTMEEYYVGQTWDAKAKEWRRKESADPDEQLSAALCAPVYKRWGGFAGDFYVNGTVTWDVSTGTVREAGEQEVKQYEPYEEEV